MRAEEADLLVLPEHESRLGNFVRSIDEFYSSSPADAVAAAELLSRALPDTRCVTELLLDAVGIHRSGAGIDHGTSYAHRNGFTKVSLVRDQCAGWNLRLHVWWARARDAQIHDHRWDLSSLVLAGSLRAVNYHAGPGDDYTIALYSDGAADGSKSITPSGMCALRPVSSYMISAGGTHSLFYTEPHMLDHPGAEPAATLVLTGPAQRDFSRAFVPRRASVPAAVRPLLLDRDSAIGEVGRFAEHLRDVGS